MAVKWQLSGSKYRIKKGSKLTYPYKLARLSAAADLSKQWVVVYYVWSIKQEKLVRKRVVVTGNTLEDRQRVADEIIREVNQALKAGAVEDEDNQLPVPVVVPTPTPVTNLIAAVVFFLQIKANSLKKNSLKTYRSSLKQFTTYLANVIHTVSALTIDNSLTNRQIESKWLLTARGLR